MVEVVFLIGLALVFIIFAVVQDLKKREIANWLNFSLVIFALAFRFFWSLFYSSNFSFFYQGLLGASIFFLLANFLYYSKMFAGGDAKLLFSLGAILPLSNLFLVNLNLYILFLFIFLFSGAIFGLFSTTFLIIKYFRKFKKEFLKQFKKNRNLMVVFLFFACFILIISISNNISIIFAILIFILPYVYLGAKSVDEVCMVKKIPPSRLSEGDWLYKDVLVGKTLIKKSWDGLTKKDIKLLSKKKSVLIRQGIPFSPVFLFSFLIFIYLWFSGLWNSFW